MLFEEVFCLRSICMQWVFDDHFLGVMQEQVKTLTSFLGIAM